jgi:hypothetical protein
MHKSFFESGGKDTVSNLRLEFSSIKEMSKGEIESFAYKTRLLQIRCYTFLFYFELHIKSLIIKESFFAPISFK